MSADADRVVEVPREELIAGADLLAQFARQIPTLDANGRAAVLRKVLAVMPGAYPKTTVLLDALHTWVEQHLNDLRDAWVLIETSKGQGADTNAAGWIVTLGLPEGWRYTGQAAALGEEGEPFFSGATLDEALEAAVLGLFEVTNQGGTDG